MTDIPRARELIDHVRHHAELSPEHFDMLGRALSLMTRKQPEKRAPVTSVELTDAVKDEILRLKYANPDISHQEIAILVRTNDGRVSETLHGLHGERWRFYP